jgi:hypothetical protein
VTADLVLREGQPLRKERDLGARFHHGKLVEGAPGNPATTDASTA